MSNIPGWSYIGSFPSPSMQLTIGDPCYTDPEDDRGPWLAFCEQVCEQREQRREVPLVVDMNLAQSTTNHPWPGHGFVSPNWRGDGTYPVYRNPQQSILIISYDEDAFERTRGNVDWELVGQFDIDSGVTWVGEHNGEIATSLRGTTLHAFAYEIPAGITMIKITTTKPGRDTLAEHEDHSDAKA